MEKQSLEKCISNKIKYINFILTLGMVMYHAKSLNGYNLDYKNFFDELLVKKYLTFADHIGYVCMVFFFFMSAFWFYQNLNSFSDILSKFKKRIKTLLVPFILWMIIVFVYKAMINDINIYSFNIFLSFFEAPINGPLWYLLALLMLQFFSPVFLLLKKVKNKFISIGIFLIAIIFVFLRKIQFFTPLLVFKNWWWYENIIYYLPVYMLGAYIGMNYSKYILKKSYDKWYYFVIGIVCLIASLLLWKFFNNKNYYVIFSIVELVGIWMIFKTTFSKKELPKFLNCSFFVYALHGPILIPITRKIIFKFLKDSYICGVELIILKLFQILLILACSYIIKIICKFIFSKKIYDGLSGGRN